MLLSYEPNGGYGHPDHKQVHRVGRRAAEIAGTPRLLEATVPRDTITKAIDLAGKVYRFPPAFDRSSFDRAFSKRSEITHRISVRRYISAKRASMRAHASQASADLADLEFCQFQPTALALPGTPHDGVLITEAIRGEGAKLLGADGERFTDELAPRDAVTAAILEQMRIDGTAAVALDLREIDPTRFPNVFASLAKAGLDPHSQPVPVSPAAHYTMGGIVVDVDGRSSLAGLSRQQTRSGTGGSHTTAGTPQPVAQAPGPSASASRCASIDTSSWLLTRPSRLSHSCELSSSAARNRSMVRAFRVRRAATSQRAAVARLTPYIAPSASMLRRSLRCRRKIAFSRVPSASTAATMASCTCRA